MPKPARSTLISVFACIGTVLSAAAQTTTTWVGGTFGEWDYSLSWNNGIPDGNFIAIFDAPTDGKSISVTRFADPGEPFRLKGLETTFASGILNIFNGTLAFDQGGTSRILAADGSYIDFSTPVLFDQELEVMTASPFVSVTFSGDLTSSGSAYLRKTGEGRLSLIGANPGLTGSATVGGFANVGINIEAGEVAAAGATSLGSARVRFAGTGSGDATLDLPAATFGNGLVFDHGGTGASRIRTPLGTTVTFTTTDIAGTSRITLLNDGTGSGGPALFRFKGAGLTVGNNVELPASDRMEIGAGFDTSSQSWSGAISGGGRLNVVGNVVLSGNNTYSGLTVVSIGSVLVHGSNTGGGEWRVNGFSAALGGGGFIDSDVVFESEAKFVFSQVDTLTVANGREVLFDPFFNVANGLVAPGLAPVDWAGVPEGTYTLITNDSDFSGLQNFGFANRATGLAGGREAWFAQSGGLQLVVIPEPSLPALFALGIGGLACARCRRKRPARNI